MVYHERPSVGPQSSFDPYQSQAVQSLLNQSQMQSQFTQSEQFQCSVSYNEVYVWGENAHGQLGIGQIPHGAATISSEYQLESQAGNANLPKICCFNTIVQKVACGMSHTIMLSSTGHIYAMGSNQYG